MSGEDCQVVKTEPNFEAAKDTSKAIICSLKMGFNASKSSGHRDRWLSAPNFTTLIAFRI